MLLTYPQTGADTSDYHLFGVTIAINWGDWNVDISFPAMLQLMLFAVLSVLEECKVDIKRWINGILRSPWLLHFASGGDPEGL